MCICLAPLKSVAISAPSFKASILIGPALYGGRHFNHARPAFVETDRTPRALKCLIACCWEARLRPALARAGREATRPYDHKHRLPTTRPYHYSGAVNLLEDFWNEVYLFFERHGA